MKKLLKTFAILLVLFNFQSTYSQNTVCFEIEPNPNSSDPALSAFTKYVNVFGIGIYAEETVANNKVLHCAAAFAEWLDNNEDGVVDDSLVLNELLSREALMPIFKSEGSAGEETFAENYEGEGVGAVCYEGEIVPERPLVDEFDATLEENLHTISSLGYANAYPEAFAEGPNSGSRLTIAMDRARGGHFLTIPNPYPEEAWYHYDDNTCNYDCMATEYFYWGLTSMLGIQDYGARCQDIANEWEACTAEQFETMDTTLFNLFSDSKYTLPTSAPDGNYCPTTSSGQGNLSIPNNKLKIYPNPAKSEIKCQVLSSGDNSLKIYTSNGQLIYNQQIIEPMHKVQLKDWPLGLYLVVLNDSDYQKLVVME